MFDPEQAIANWRQRMLAAGIEAPAPLEELENHLREEIERQARSGICSQKAFEIASKKIGRPAELKTEFKKIPGPMEIRFVKMAGIACSVVGALFLLWTVYVAMFLREASWGSRAFGLLAVAALVASWRCAGRFLPVIRHQRIRSAISLLACVAGFGGTLVFIRLVLPDLFVAPTPADFSINRLIVSFVVAWTGLAILGAVACRLDDAAGKTEAGHV